jgi:hypothetical protein
LGGRRAAVLIVLLAVALVSVNTVSLPSVAEATGRPTADLGARAGARLPSVLNKGGEEATYSSIGPGGGPFALGGGTYELDLLAQYAASDDTDNTGKCAFYGYVDGGSTPVHVSLSADGPIPEDYAGFHLSPVLILPGGNYLLDVLQGTTCWWKFVVLDLGQPVFSKTGRHLLPTALHQGMCLQQAYTDGSEQAQVDLYGTTCTEVSQTLGVDAANKSGGSFRSGSFTCLSTAEGPGSPWAASWHGTYFTYDCTANDSQAAFNWGRHYAL